MRIGGLAFAVMALFALSVAPAPAAVSFTKAEYTLASYALPGSVQSELGSANGSLGDEKPVAVADMNGDGKPDIVAADYEANVIYVLLNNGDGTFSSAAGSPFSVAATCHQPDSILPGDFNKDGKLDLLVQCGSPEELEVFPGDGHGGLGAATATMRGFGPMFIANIDGDTDVVYNVVPKGTCTMDIENLETAGNKDLLRLCQEGSGYQYGSSVHWDTSGCGGDEWITTGGESGHGTRNLTVTAGVQDPANLNACDLSATSEFDTGIALGNFVNDVITTDLTGDGSPDIVTSDYGSGGGLRVFGVSTASGIGISGPTTLVSSAHSSSVASADFSADGKADLAGAEWGPIFNSANQIAIYEGLGSTTAFAAPQYFPVYGDNGQNTFPKLAVADLNGDGLPDIVVGGNACNAEETLCTTKLTVLLDTTKPASASGPAGGGPKGGGAVPPFAGVKLAGGALIVRGKVVVLKLVCPPESQQQCAGKVTLTTAKAFAARARRRHVTLGSAAFSIPAGQTRTVKIRINAKGLKLLRRHHKLAVIETVAAHDARGTSVVSVASLNLRLAARGHRH